MSGNALPIGHYQLDNLVSGRLSFIIFHWGVDFSENYSGVELQHVRNYGVELNPLEGLPAQAQTALLERNFPINSPIIVVCRDGKKSKELADFLGSKGHINSFYLLGGFDANP